MDERYAIEEPIMKFFQYAHLPERLQAPSKACAELAMLVMDTANRSAERTVALRKILEAKDAYVRAML